MAAKCSKVLFFYLKNYYQKVDKYESKLIQQNVQKKSCNTIYNGLSLKI